MILAQIANIKVDQEHSFDFGLVILQRIITSLNIFVGTLLQFSDTDPE